VPIAVKAGANASLLVFKKENKAAFGSLTAYMDNKLGLEELLGNACFKPYNNSWKQPLTPAQKIVANRRVSIASFLPPVTAHGAR